MAAKVIDREDFGLLIEMLADAGYRVVGPTKTDDAIVYGDLSEVAQLPIGWTDVQEAGSYRLVRRSDDAFFGYNLGPRAWKSYLFPPRSTLLTIESVGGDLVFSTPEESAPPLAFFGIRACELAAIAVQDKVFLSSGYVDRIYATNRREVFTVGVNCAVAGGTCFCVSMGTGPECTSGSDLIVTEIIDEGVHEFLVAAGSDAGGAMLTSLPGRDAAPADHSRASAIIAATAANMGRRLETDGIKDILYANRDAARWDDVAARCLTCTNCTLVCPTCFCSTTEDTASLDSTIGQRTRRWDSCFTLDFTSLHGDPVRESPRARYRQWLTHKLASWQDQFGSSGCVGCGRCITWCPVGIDITEESAALRAGMEVPA